MRYTIFLLLPLLTFHPRLAQAQDCHTSPISIRGADLVDNGSILRIMVNGIDRSGYNFAYFDLANGGFLRNGKMASDTEVDGPPGAERMIRAKEGCCDGTVEITHNGSKVLKEYFSDAHGLYVSYDFAHQRGIVFVMSGGSTNSVYIVKPGSKPDRIKKTISSSKYRYFTFSADGHYALSPTGTLVDMEKQKVVSDEFGPGIGNTIATAVFNPSSSQCVRFSVDGAKVALPLGQAAMEVRSVPDGKLLRTISLPAGIKPEAGNKAIPTTNLDGFIFLTEPRYGGDIITAGSGRDAWLIKEGSATKLCMPLADSIAAIIAEMDKASPQAKSTPQSPASMAPGKYRELLSYIADTDRQFAPYATKIMKAGKDAWSLYGARQKAHDILNRQEMAIKDYLSQYRSYTSATNVASLEARLSQIRDARSSIPAN